MKKNFIVEEYEWITSIRITQSNARKIVGAGRNRWKKENQGFKRQKYWQGIGISSPAKNKSTA